jgi:hypothetical protein
MEIKEVKIVSEELIPLNGTIIYSTNINENMEDGSIAFFIPEDKLYEKTIIPINREYFGGELKLIYKNLNMGFNKKYKVNDVLGKLVFVKGS